MTKQHITLAVQRLFYKFLNGETTIEEEDALSKTLCTDPLMRLYARELEKKWEHEYQSTMMTNRAWEETSRQLHKEQRRVYHRSARQWFAAASFLLLCGFSGLFVFYHLVESPVQNYAYSVPAGHQLKVVLPDSSVVWLNAKSTLRYNDFSDEDKRRVELKGEGYFEIRHSDTKPFIVSTKNFNVQVMGTKFDVTAYPSDTTSSVVLVSGSVEVSKRQLYSKACILKPGQRYQLASNGNVRVSNVEVSRYVSWSTGRMVLTDISMEELSQTLERYYGMPVIADSSVSELRYSGVIDLHNNLEAALSDLTKILPVQIKKGHGYYTISL